MIGPPNGVFPLVLLPLLVLECRIRSVDKQLLLYVAHSIDVAAGSSVVKMLERERFSPPKLATDAFDVPMDVLNECHLNVEKSFSFSSSSVDRW